MASKVLLIMSLIISSHSEETIPIMIGLSTSKVVWNALAAAFLSPSNTRILNLHMQLQNLKRDVVCRPICLPDQNIYIFKGLIVTLNVTLAYARLGWKSLWAEAVIMVEDKNIEETHLLEIHGPHLTLAHYVKYRRNTSHHPDHSNLHHVEDYKGMDQVHIGNGQGLPIHHTGQSDDGLFSLNLQPSYSKSSSKSPSTFLSSRTSSACWHLHLGHPHK
ncbi:hypothetical protein KY290_001298 [Solanum tuberosum]|uniref:Uncharacterized protein n=1 Tax=Solanum tuberosum TaxID=4113 RepID=A0ABQ7WMA3_SOLTU|nr:hypothetical protein KY290_001298 [Solanum tuberosum]